VNLVLDTTPPGIVVTSPASSTVAAPLIQVQGFAGENLSGISYDISNALETVTNQAGYVTGQFYDTNLLATTTNYFQCHDVPLAAGLNTVTLHATDLAGNTATTHFNVTLDYATDTTPPELKLVWPPAGTVIAGSRFTLQAQVGDPLAGVTVSIADAGGDTNTVQGLVQGDGAVQAAGLPLASGTNTLTVITTDAAGNTAATNFMVVRGAVAVAVNPLTDDQLNRSLVGVTGTVSDTNASLTVNGVMVAVYADGTWTADNVPVKSTGTASFDLQTYDAGDNPSGSRIALQAQPTTIGLASYEDGYYYWENVHLASFWQCTNYPCSPGTNSQWVVQDCQQPQWNSGETYWLAGQGGFVQTAGFENQSNLRTVPLVPESSWEALGTNNDYYAGASGEEEDYKEGGTYATAPGAGDPYVNNYWLKSRFAFQPGRAWPAGTVRRYTVAAAVRDGYGPLPFGWFTIRGQVLTGSGETNSLYGEYGQTTITVPAGETNLDVTPRPAGSTLRDFQLAEDDAYDEYPFEDTYYEFDLKIVKDKLYWQNRVMDEMDADSGVAIENYLAGNGFITNRLNIQAVYAFYQKLFTEQPTHFYWAGLAKLAGAPVYAGLSDAQYCKEGLITSGYLTLDDLGAGIVLSLLESKAAGFQTNLIQMNIDIYSDMDWQFEAYKNDGLQALEEIYAVDPTLFDIDAWKEIDDGIQNGDDAEIQDGNTLLAQQEQNVVLVEDYQKLSNLFPGTSSLMSRLAQNPIIGGPDFLTVEPGGDLANTAQRWDWVSRSYTGITNTGIFPLWLQESASTRLLDVQQPLLTRALQFSYVYNYISTSLPLF